MKRQLTIVLLLVTVLALLVGACGPSQPAATPTKAAAAPAAAGKWCSGVRIVFFPGGPQGGVFAVNVYNGAVQAAADLGPKVDYVWSDWDPQKMIQQFREVGECNKDAGNRDDCAGAQPSS